MKRPFAFVAFALLFLAITAVSSFSSRQAVFVGTFRDYRGFEGSFFVDAETGHAYGPLTASSIPRFTVGAIGEINFDANLQFKSFVPSAKKSDFLKLSPKISDPLTLGLLANHPVSGEVFFEKIKSLENSAAKENAVYGMLLASSRDKLKTFLEKDPQSDLRVIAALYAEGLKGLAQVSPCDPHIQACHPLYALIPAAKSFLKKEPKETITQRLYEGMLGMNISKPLFSEEHKKPSRFARGILDFQDLLMAKDEIFYLWLQEAAKDVTSYRLGYVLGFRQRSGREFLAIAYGLFWTEQPNDSWDAATILEIPWEFGETKDLDFGKQIQFVLKEGRQLAEFRLLEKKPADLVYALQISKPSRVDWALGYLARAAKNKFGGFSWENWHELAKKVADSGAVREVLLMNPDSESARQMERYADSREASLWIVTIYLINQDYTSAKKLLSKMENADLAGLFKVLSENLERKMPGRIPKDVNAPEAAREFKEFIKPLDPRIQSKWLITLEASGFKF